MGMNIKDPQVHAMARQLAARRGTTVTDAVRQALAAELERSADRPDPPAQLQKARREELERLLQRFRRLHWPDQRSSEELQAELYDEHGLPI
jgi:antitoxin VapB